MKLYEVEINGVRTTMQLDEDHKKAQYPKAKVVAENQSASDAMTPVAPDAGSRQGNGSGGPGTGTPPAPDGSGK